jgi:hypothetical protein
MYAYCNQTINGNQRLEANKIIEFIWELKDFQR